jgi:hypothetical protein
MPRARSSARSNSTSRQQAQVHQEVLAELSEADVIGHNTDGEILAAG